MAIQRSLNSTIDGQGVQCGIGIGVNAQVKIISMNAMNGYGGTKSHIQQRVCERICVRACMCAEGKKANDSQYQYFRDIGGPQNCPETSARQ